MMLETNALALHGVPMIGFIVLAAAVIRATGGLKLSLPAQSPRVSGGKATAAAFLFCLAGLSFRYYSSRPVPIGEGLRAGERAKQQPALPPVSPLVSYGNAPAKYMNCEYGGESRRQCGLGLKTLSVPPICRSLFTPPPASSSQTLLLSRLARWTSL